MTVIYVDTLFLLNVLVDYLLLLCAARLAGEPLKRLRFALGAVLGGGYAVAIFLPGLGFLERPACRLAAAVLMVLAAFWGSRRLGRQVLIFFALSCAFAGGVLAISMMGGQGLSLNRGVIYSGMDLKIVLLSAAGCYAVLSLLLQKAVRHTSFTGELKAVRLELEDRTVELTALTDTGNTLTDPVTGQGVMVAEGERLLPLFAVSQRPSVQELRDPAGALERLTGAGGHFRLLPYRAVGVDRGLLLAVRVDRAVVDGEDRGAMVVALSPTPVSDGGGYGALLGEC
ncbi:sigma-E processing peptidase SpoIIGA [Pseudoflavonifractor phocaeensis]|nr:sigma-E processing peptidase SpoIIGA [Pseudoflavonifractor phocaeensis]MCF2676445.1 sigma-E processing peptidase SpoIIGA [Pseudoflavonifractor phocaeensis]